MEIIVPSWAIVASGFVLLLMMVLLFITIRLHKRLSKFVKGKDGLSLEATIEWLTKKTAQIDDALVAHKEALEFLDKRVKRSIRGYSLIRYNAYEGAGGEQSFSSGLIDEHGDGYILSVVSNRNHTGVYAKKIIAGSSDVSLTDEESQALEQAKKGLK